VACTNLQDTLFESELFGVRPGAYTGAVHREGAFERAEGGTLFLDEIGELDIERQRRLLKVLDDGVYQPLGDKPKKANVRIVTATNVDLTAAVAAGTFRKDLLYRITVATIEIPPLTERAEDIVPIAEQCMEQFRPAKRGAPRLKLSMHARMALEGESWPGNVRDLRHTVERALMRLDDDVEVLEAQHIFPKQEAPADRQTFASATHEFHRRLLKSTLIGCDWNVSQTAERLDLARQYVHTLIKKYNLARDDIR
jgi:two-component system C4-dicarboxylate transport response regulator DctD